MATTKTKADVVDYLWEWANEQGEWAKSLVTQICIKEDALSKEEQDFIFDQFIALAEIGASKTGEVVDSIKPILPESSSVVKLKSIGNVKGVNRLAENQTIFFSDNIMVIYGGNGSGKTGYARILKELGFTYGSKSKILPNILEEKPSTAKSAEIRYCIDEKGECFYWDGSNKCDDIAGISVFDSSCINISLNEERSLVVTPMGFIYLDLLPMS